MGTLTVSYSTFFSNTSYGGAIAAFGPTTIVNSTFSNNEATQDGGAIFTNTPSLTLSNNIFAGNSASSVGAAIYASLHQVIGSNNLFYQNYDTGTTTEDDCYKCTLTPVNPVSGNPNLAPLGNYGGPTPTMLPLPASAAICAASSTLIPTGISTDQRGLPNSTTYNSTACTDLGAIQTSYSLNFTSTPPATGTAPGTAMSPQAVAVDESSNPLIAGSASVSVTDAKQDLTTTPATAVTSSGVATFSSLIFTNSTTSDTLTAALALNPNLPTLIISSAPSKAFSVGVITPTVTFTGAPASAAYNSKFTVASTTNSGATVSITSSGACSNIGTSVTMTSGAGTCNLTATWLANGNYTGASLPQSTKAGQASQTITFTLPAAVNYGVAPIALTPTASSGLPITYTLNSGPATVTGTASAPTLTITGAGTVKLTASQGGNTNYLAASPVSQSMTVNAVPLATLSTSSINFGTLYLAQIVTQTVTITNSGDATMAFSGDPLIAIVQGGNSSEFITVNLCPASLAAGKSCIMTVTFLAGPFYTPQTATLTIKDNVAGSPQTVMLTATVIDPVPSFSATSLSLGTVKTGTPSASKSIAVTNVGGTALTITNIVFAGADPGDFSQTNTCSASLAPKGTCTISVTFKPGAKTARTATLVVTDNAVNSPQRISLSGTGD